MLCWPTHVLASNVIGAIDAIDTTPPFTEFHPSAPSCVASFDVKSDITRLLRVLLDLIVAFRIIDELVTIIVSVLWVMEVSPLLPLAAASLVGWPEDAGFL